MKRRLKYRLLLLPAFLLLLTLISLPLYSFDLSSGKSVNSIIKPGRRFSAGGRIFKPSYSADTDWLYVFAEDSRFYIFIGDRLYKKIKLTSSPLFPPAAGKDGTIYCNFKDRTLRAYNRGGKLLWLKKLPSQPLFPPVVNSRGNISVFLKNNEIHSYALNGRLRWIRQSEISPFSDPLSSGRGIIFNDGEADKIISDRGVISPVPGSENITAYFAASGRLFTVKKADKDGFSSLALNDRMFNEKWSLELKGLPCDLKISGNNIYILTDRGFFYRTDLKGKVLKEKKTAASGRGKFTVLEKYIYLVNPGSSFIRLYTLDFDFADRISLPGEALSGMKSAESSILFSPEPVFSGGNRIVLGGNDWILYFYDISDTVSREEVREDDYPEAETEKEISENLHYIQELSKSGRYGNRMKALSLIEELIKEGGFSDYEYEILDILFRLGTEGTVTISRNSMKEESNAVLRSRASELIYSAGTGQSLEMLRKMINAENDEYVIIKDISLLGMGGSDPGLGTLRAFRGVLERTEYDKRICSAVVSASENIAVYNGYLPHEYSSLLMEMMDIHSDNNLKDKIIRLLVRKQY